MASPETDYHAWLSETAELIEHGRWEDVDLAGLAEELRGLARAQVRELQRAITRWLEAGARRDHAAARAEMAIIRDRLTRSPSLADYEALRQRVHSAWRAVERQLRAEGRRIPRVSYQELDQAAGKIRWRLGSAIW